MIAPKRPKPNPPRRLLRPSDLTVLLDWIAEGLQLGLSRAESISLACDQLEVRLLNRLDRIASEAPQ